MCGSALTGLGTGAIRISSPPPPDTNRIEFPAFRVSSVGRPYWLYTNVHVEYWTNSHSTWLINRTQSECKYRRVSENLRSRLQPKSNVPRLASSNTGSRPKVRLFRFDRQVTCHGGLTGIPVAYAFWRDGHFQYGFFCYRPTNTVVNEAR